MDDLIFEGRMPISEDQACAITTLYQGNVRDVAITGQDATEALRVEGTNRAKRNVQYKINVIGDIDPEEGVEVD